MKRDREPWDEPSGMPPWVLALAIAIGCLMPLICGCRMVEQIQATPEEVWVALWMVLEAAVLDVVDLVKVIL